MVGSLSSPTRKVNTISGLSSTTRIRLCCWGSKDNGEEVGFVNPANIRKSIHKHALESKLLNLIGQAEFEREIQRTVGKIIEETPDLDRTTQTDPEEYTPKVLHFLYHFCIISHLSTGSSEVDPFCCLTIIPSFTNSPIIDSTIVLYTIVFLSLVRNKDLLVIHEVLILRFITTDQTCILCHMWIWI